MFISNNEFRLEMCFITLRKLTRYKHMTFSCLIFLKYNSFGTWGDGGSLVRGRGDTLIITIKYRYCIRPIQNWKSVFYHLNCMWALVGI